LEIKRLLSAAIQWKEGSMAAAIAIALFAGLRPSEIAGLKPEDIREKGIRVRGGKLRRKTNRMVPIPDNLKVWLETYPFVGLPSHYQRSYRVLRKATETKNWVQDILRHTSISYQLERDQNEGLTLFNAGTSQAMANRHYREVIEDSEHVEQFWALTPDKVRNLKVNFDKVPSRKTVQWPSDKKLLEMVHSMPMTQVGKAIGVSDNAVRKRMKVRGLEKRPTL
jgi:integrase